jgi:two-component system, NarL family, invasion response regulator UvrY
MDPGKIKILIADDHSIVRAGVIKSLSACFPEAVFGEAANAAEIMRMINETKWNLLILDISMPGRNGMEVLKEVKDIHPEIPVIIFSMYPEDQFAVRSLRAGAAAYLTKDIPSKEFAEAIRMILRGERYITPSLMELLTNEIRQDSRKPLHEILSDREYQVFLLIASGKNVSLVGSELNLSVKTISVYRANILKKMNLKNNSEITHYAFKHNLVE